MVFAAELNTAFNMRDASGECLIDEQTVGLQIIAPSAGGRFPTLAHQVIAERHRKANIAEEMRILYVALTRAREKLILTAGKKGQACANLLSECAAFADGIPDWRLGEGRCHLDWVLMSMARDTKLCKLFEIENPNASANKLFHASRLDRDELDAMTQQILEAKRSLTSYTTAPKPGSEPAKASAAAFEGIRKNLLWQYPFDNLTQVSAKVSVSELTHANDEFAAVDVSQAFHKKPAVATAITKRGQTPLIAPAANALSIGTAVHAVIEHIDLTQPVTTAALSATVKMLTEKALIDAAAAKAIDLSAIAAFFDSDLGQLAQQNANAVYREWPFTYALSPDTLTKRGQEPLNSDEIVIVQGIVDMIIPTPEGLVIVDFKTDRVTGDEIQQRADRYATQLHTYARAAGDILNKPVKATWLYFLTPQTAIEVMT